MCVNTKQCKTECKIFELRMDGSFASTVHPSLFTRGDCPRERIVNTQRGCDPSLVHRVPRLTSCYSCDVLSHKSVRSDTGVRWPADPGLVLVDKLNAFYLNTACQSFPVNRAGLRHGWMWHCGAMRRQTGPLRGQQGAGGRHHNSSSVHTQASPTNSKCKAQGALNIIATVTTCLQGGWRNRVRQRGTGGTGGSTPGNLGSDGWLVITGKWSAFALQHSISTVSLGRAMKRWRERESEELQNHTQCNEDRPEWLNELSLKDLKCMW